MKILMVCLGNICRSPLAEGILRSKLPDNFTVDSAGTLENNEGKSPDHRSLKTARKYGIDISKQVSRRFSVKDFDQYDYIFCMDRQNLNDVLSLAKTEEQRAKVSLILDDEELPDPFWSDLPEFERVYGILDKATDKIAEKLLKSAKEQGEEAKK